MPARPESLDVTLGALLVSVITSSCLYGVTCLQVWSYFRNYNDGHMFRVMVISLAILGTVHEIMSIHTIYFYLITNFANLAAMSKLAWSTGMIIPLTLLIAVIVQSFYIVRIHQMSYRKDWIIPTLLSFLIVTEIVLSAVAIAKIYHLQSFDRIAEDEATRRVMYAEFSSVVACDVSCALALSYYLHKGRSGIKRTNNLINRLILYTINNGALTSVTSISIMICLSLDIRNFVYASIYVNVANLYISSLLSTLNMRKSLDNSTTITVNMESVELGAFQAAGRTTIASMNAPIEGSLVIDTKGSTHGVGRCDGGASSSSFPMFKNSNVK